MYTDSATRVFDSYGRLISLVNTANSATNTVLYVCNDGTNLEDIAKIIDGVGNEYRFTYTDGLLTKIKCYNSDGNAIIAGDGENSAPLEMNFAYTSGKLTTVTFPDGKTVSYGYNSADVMLRAVNIDGYMVEINYTDGYASRIAEYSPIGSNSYNIGSYINISSSDNTRTFTDNNGEVQIKTFDDTGRILTIVDGDGNYLYGAPIQDEEDSTVTEEDSSDYIYEEDTSEFYESVCPCSDCTEWECACECESEEVCNCVQCKRYSDTIEDTHGNVLSEESFDGTKTMKSQNFYTSDGNYLASSVDTSGNTVYYIYDEAGFMQSMTSGDTEVLFDYDAMGNLTRLYQQVSGLSNGTTMSNQYTYTNDRVTSITHNGFTYNFTYDEWGNQTSIKINERVYLSNEYDDENHDRLSKVNYSNGQSITYSYDDNNNITGVSYDNGVTNAFVYEYDSDAKLTKITDNSTGYTTTYSDTGFETKTSDNKLIYSSIANENGTVTENLLGSAITYTFNSDYNQVSGKTVSDKDFTKASSVVNDDGVTVNTQADVGTTVTTDWFGRTTTKNITIATDRNTGGISEEYFVSGETEFTYTDTETNASTKVLSQTSTFTSDLHTNSRTDYYEYDATGNITGIYRYVDGVKAYYYTYVYDEAGQLVRENILEDNKTILYVYDVGGNIVSKTVYAYTLGEITDEMIPTETTNFGYNYSECNDLLTDFSYTKTGSSSSNITSSVDNDYMGNVLSFNDIEFEWKAGRQLSSVIDDNEEMKHYYNSDGRLIRVECYINNVLEDITHYTWDGDRLIGRTIERDDNESITSRVIYDAEGEAIGFIAEAPLILDYDITFLYRKNLQGDITGLIDENGEMWVEFTYDAYGVPQIHVPDAPDNTFAQAVQASIGLMLTPQLYRGYAYAAVGEMYTYYLGSRYYVPQFCRFLNSDKHTDTQTGVLATNMFAYCNNNPVMYVDPTGEALDDTLSLFNTIVNFIKSVFSKLFPNKNTVSESNPLELSQGISAMVNAKSYWFKCSVRGATEITVTSSTDVTIYVYKRKNLFKKELIGTYEGNIIIEKFRENFNNTYFVNVESKVESLIACQISQYVDYKSDINGAMWVAEDTTPIPNDSILYFKKWYVNKEKVDALYRYVSESKFLDYQTNLINGTISVATAVASIYLPIPDKISIALSVVSSASAFFSDPINVKQSVIDDILEYSGYNETDYSYANGLVLTECMSNGVMHYFVERWDGPDMYGEEGYCGIWINKN